MGRLPASEDLSMTVSYIRRKISRIERELAEVRETVDLVLERLIEQRERSASLVKPRSSEVQTALQRSKILAEAIKKLPPEEQVARFRCNIEEIRAEAIAKGTAIDDEKEAAVGD